MLDRAGTPRIRRRADFQRLFREGRRGRAGPLRIHLSSLPGAPSRMGMAVGRKVGGAVRRNRVKRLLRTALRNLSEGWPGSVEVIVVVEPHPPATLEQYTRWLNEAVRSTASWPEHSP